MALSRPIISRSSDTSCTSTVTVTVERLFSMSRAVSVRTLALSALSAVATSITRPERCVLSSSSVVLYSSVVRSAQLTVIQRSRFSGWIRLAI